MLYLLLNDIVLHFPSPLLFAGRIQSLLPHYRVQATRFSLRTRQRLAKLHEGVITFLREASGPAFLLFGLKNAGLWFFMVY